MMTSFPLYPILATLFFLTIIFSLFLLIGFILKPKFWRKYNRRIRLIAALWSISYLIFVIFLTGPVLSQYPRPENSFYKLPWKAGVSRFVAQGNRSFTSHRDFHLYAWDFLMPSGTEVLAARDGEVVEVVDRFDGIGFESNIVVIRHADGERSAYAHIQNKGALVQLGELVRQGQPIARSGMVGQAPGPHLHFYVINKEGTSSVPISFRDVAEGVPLAGHFYRSENGERAP